MVGCKLDRTRKQNIFIRRWGTENGISSETRSKWGVLGVGAHCDRGTGAEDRGGICRDDGGGEVVGECEVKILSSTADFTDHYGSLAMMLLVVIIC